MNIYEASTENDILDIAQNLNDQTSKIRRLAEVNGEITNDTLEELRDLRDFSRSLYDELFSSGELGSATIILEELKEVDAIVSRAFLSALKDCATLQQELGKSPEMIDLAKIENIIFSNFDPMLILKVLSPQSQGLENLVRVQREAVATWKKGTVGLESPHAVIPVWTKDRAAQLLGEENDEWGLTA